MRCTHDTTEPVIPLGTDQPVAEVCTDCLERLPLGWSCPDCSRDEIRILNGDIIDVHVPCPRHRE